MFVCVCVCMFLCTVMCAKVKMTKEEKREYQIPESKVTGGFECPTWVFRLNSDPLQGSEHS